MARASFEPESAVYNGGANLLRTRLKAGSLFHRATIAANLHHGTAGFAARVLVHIRPAHAVYTTTAFGFLIAGIPEPPHIPIPGI
jgi:hypothetical protein